MPPSHIRNRKGFTQPHFLYKGRRASKKDGFFIYRIHSLKKIKSGAGFTLIELLVVIAIIGILASMLIIVFGNVKISARDKRRLADVRQIFTAMDLYYSKHGAFPCTDSTSLDSAFLQELVTDGVLATNPKDPINSPSVAYYRYTSWPVVHGGPCGQIAELDLNMEDSKTPCPPNGVKPAGSTRHCHNFYPTPLPCSQPYLANATEQADDCDALKN